MEKNIKSDYIFNDYLIEKYNISYEDYVNFFISCSEGYIPRFGKSFGDGTFYKTNTLRKVNKKIVKVYCGSGDGSYNYYNKSSDEMGEDILSSFYQMCCNRGCPDYDK